VVLWTVAGVRVGNFGRDTWTWDNPTTWAATAIEPIDQFAVQPGSGVDDGALWASDILPDSDEEEEAARGAGVCVYAPPGNCCDLRYRVPCQRWRLTPARMGSSCAAGSDRCWRSLGGA
jgi:hypothetical protein